VSEGPRRDEDPGLGAIPGASLFTTVTIADNAAHRRTISRVAARIDRLLMELLPSHVTFKKG